MAAADPVRLSPRPWVLLFLRLVCGAVPSVCVAGQATSIETTIRLPIVDATDNRFVRLSTAQGISQIKVDHIVQDDKGFMWFGTRYGLYRYDGYNFKVFVHDPGNPNSLDGVFAAPLNCARVRAPRMVEIAWSGPLWSGPLTSFPLHLRSSRPL